MANAEMKKCPVCGTYTTRPACPRDGNETRTPYPPKFSIEDKYATYRRKAKYG